MPLCPDFQAPSLASASTFSYLLSSVLQRPVRLIALNNPSVATLIVGAGANVALTAVPSGILF
jgi:hypothetical protein